MRHNLFLLTLSSLLLLTSGQDVEAECEAEEDAVEKCAFDFLLLRNTSIVQNPSDMSTFCTAQKANEQCLTDHSKKCLSHSANHAIGELIRGMVKQNEIICANKGQRRLYQRSGTCLAAHQPEMNTCYQKFISDIHGLHQFGQTEKMPLICCSYTAFQTCVSGLAKSKCDSDVSKALPLLIKVYAGETLNYVCNDYKTKCSNFEKPEVDASKIQEEIPKTFFSLLVKIYLS